MAEITDVRLMNITKYDNNVSPTTLAMAKVVLDDCFAIGGIKLVRTWNTTYIKMPSTDNKTKPVCHPVNDEFRKKLLKAIVDKYEEIIKTM